MLKYKVCVLLFFILQSLSIIGQEVLIEEVQEYDEEVSVNLINSIEVFRSDDRKYGIRKSISKEVLLKPIYKDITKRRSIFIIKDMDNKFGAYDSNLKKFVLPLSFDEVLVYGARGRGLYKDAKDYIFLVKKNGKRGVLDNKQKNLIPIKYDELKVENGWVILEKDDKQGVYFFDNEKSIPLKYSKIGIYGGMIAGFLDDHRINLFNDEGKLLIKNCEKIERFHNVYSHNNSRNFLVTLKNRKCGIFNSKKEETILPFVYDDVIDQFENYFIVKKDGKYGLVNNSKTYIDFEYDEISFLKPFKITDPILVSKKGKFGLVNLENKLTDLSYDEIKPLNNFYKARIDNKYFILDNSGKKITNKTFSNVGTFHNNIAAIFDNGKLEGYIDINGNIVNEVKKEIIATGYDDLDTLYIKFVSVLKSLDDDKLKIFTNKIVFDEYTEVFFNRISYEYRGFPVEMKKRGYTIEDARQGVYDALKSFRDNLARADVLRQLEYIGLNNQNKRYGLWNKEHKLLGIETFCILKSGEKKIKFKLGEMILSDGFWKTFTRPRRL